MNLNNMIIFEIFNKDPFNHELIEMIENIKEFDVEIINDKDLKLDYFALKYYNDYNFWWIIARYNNILNPFFQNDVKIIKIPKFIEIMEIERKLKEKYNKDN